MKEFVIYVIRNLLNGHSYIGSTSNFGVRRKAHFSKLKHKKHHSYKLQRAYNKHGKTAFIIVLIEHLNTLDQDIAFQREQVYLDLFKPVYNVSPKAKAPSRFGQKNSPAHNKKISEANKGNSHKGWHHTEDAKLRMGLHHNKNSNLPRSKESLKKLSDSNLKRWASYSKEKKLEIAKKISQSHTIIKRTKCVICTKEIEYHSSGKYIPKTCSPECLSKYRKNILNARRQKDPGMDQRAIRKRWGPEPRKKAEPKYRRVPSQKGPCLVCNKEIKYYAYGGKRTCSKECSLKYLHDQSEIKSNNKTKQVCEFIKKHARTPIHRSKDPEEANLGHFLGSKRQAKVGKGTVIFFNTDQEIATSYGYPDLFKINNPESNSNLTCKKMCEWIKLNGRKPAMRSLNKEENKLAEWLHYKKKAYRGQIGVFYLSDQSIVDSYGYADIFKEKRIKL